MVLWTPQKCYHVGAEGSKPFSRAPYEVHFSELQTSLSLCRWTAYTKMRENKHVFSMVDFLSFTGSLSETKKHHTESCMEANPSWARRSWPCHSSGSTVSQPRDKFTLPLRNVQIRFLCNFQTLNKWTSRAKCFLRLGSDFCAHTRVYSQTTHIAAGCGRAIPAGISLCSIMTCLLCYLDVKRDSRGENTYTLGGWWQSGCGGLLSPSVLQHD